MIGLQEAVLGYVVIHEYENVTMRIYYWANQLILCFFILEYFFLSVLFWRCISFVYFGS